MKLLIFIICIIPTIVFSYFLGKSQQKQNTLKMNEQVNKFEELTKPLMEYLHKNFHPHAQIIINWDGAEVVEGKIGVPYAERS